MSGRQNIKVLLLTLSLLYCKTHIMLFSTAVKWRSYLSCFMKNMEIVGRKSLEVKPLDI